MRMMQLLLMVLFFSFCIRSDIDIEEIAEFKNDPNLITYVKNKYEQVVHGTAYLVYPAKTPKQLWVLFNGATVGRYTMWSWFWRPAEDWDDVAYLFLKDDDIRWYLGSKSEPKTEVYSGIINTVMQSLNLEPQQVCTIGHSMGGYAALYYGLLIGAGCIYVFRPQVTWDAAVTYYSIKKLQNIWVNIDSLILNAPTIPSLYLQYGEFLPDKKAGHALVDAYRERHGTMIVERTAHQEHVGYYPTKEHIQETIEYLLYYAQSVVNEHGQST